jgi:hypothetical protein
MVDADRTIAILSPDYLHSRFTPSEWAAAFAVDPRGEHRTLLPIRVREVDPSGLLRQVIWIDLVDADEATARERVLSAVEGVRAKPSYEPAFPGSALDTRKPAFPASGPRIKSLPARNLHFTGRTEWIGRLEHDRIGRRAAVRATPMTPTARPRAGTVSELVLGRRKEVVRRPRVRAEGREVPLPTFQAMADADPLNRRAVDPMLVSVATRRYARSMEPVPATMRRRGTSKSAVSRRFAAQIAAQLAAWQTASLDARDLVGVIIDGVHIGEHCLIVALEIAADAQKPALAL